MKTLQYILLSLTITFQCMAFEVPEDAVIKVFTKDGKQIGNMSRKEYKVVKLGTSKTTVVEKMVQRNNTVILHGGTGKDGLKYRHDGTQHVVSEKDEAVGGVTYCRKAGRWGMCGSAFTNKTFTLGVLLDF